MRLRRSVRLLALFLVTTVLGYAFLAGPLFAWSPIKPGYDVLRLERADVYFGTGRAVDPAFQSMDRYIRDTEEFHQLKLPHRMTIIVCRSWSDFHRFLPTIRGEGVGAATPEFGTVIYITPKVAQMGFDPGEFVRHELSHAVLEQNATLWNSLHFKQAPWFVEGLGVLSANQKAYGTWEEFVNRGREQTMEPLFSSPAGRTPGFDIRFAYQAWRYFLAWTVETRGRATFKRFMTGFIQRPTEATRLFREVYGEDLRAAVLRFEAAVRDGKWHVD
jgi:hypothetical protein